MKCKYCGEEIADDSMFCEHCGKSLHHINKRDSTCDIRLVKWLLYGMMFVLCASNLLVIIHLNISNSMDSGATVRTLWGIVPFLSLIVFVISLVLTIKKKLSIVFTVVLFLLFSANTVEMAVGIGCLRRRVYYTLGGTVEDLSGIIGPYPYRLLPKCSYRECLHYDSETIASEAIDQMGFSRTLSSKSGKINLDIGVVEIDEYRTEGTEDTVIIVTIVEGSILVLYLIFNAIYGFVIARKERD